MDTRADSKDYAPRGTDRVRPTSTRRPARPGRGWRSVLVLLAIALAVLAVMAARSRAASREAATAGPTGVSIDRRAGPDLAPFRQPVT